MRSFEQIWTRKEEIVFAHGLTHGTLSTASLKVGAFFASGAVSEVAR
jgi:hypothetical protein